MESVDALTFLLSSAAFSFFWISSSDGFGRGGVVALNSGPPSKVGGFRMTSKAWPLVRLLNSITSMSLMLHRFKSTMPAARQQEIMRKLQMRSYKKDFNNVSTSDVSLIFSCVLHYGIGSLHESMDLKKTGEQRLQTKIKLGCRRTIRSTTVSRIHPLQQQYVMMS